MKVPLVVLVCLSSVRVLGAAVLSPLQGKVADLFGIQHSFVVPMVAFAFIAFYGVYGYRAGRKDLVAAA